MNTQTNETFDLSGFIGSPTFARFGLTSSVMTEGIEYVATEAGAFWLFQEADLYTRQMTSEGIDTSFVVVKLKPEDGTSALLEFEDGNNNTLMQRVVGFTDFPFERFNEDAFEFWLVHNGHGWTVMLPSEY